MSDRVEVRSHGIRSSRLTPYTFLVERVQSLMPEEQQGRPAAEVPPGRLGNPRDVALFLACESSSWTTGVTLAVLGGGVMA